MKNVLFAALLGMAAATTVWAQTPPPAPPPAPIPVFDVTPVAPAPPSPPVPVFDVARPLPSVYFAQAAPAPVQPAAPAPPARAAVPAAPGTAPPAPPAPARVPAVQAPAPPLSTIHNVRFDVTITDTGTGGAKPLTKTVSVTVSAGASGSIRSTAYAPGDVTEKAASWLNVDVRISGMVDNNNGVRAGVNVEYQPYFPDSKAKVGAITAGSMSVFFDGRKTQLLVTSDPISDRRTTIDVTATILK